MVKIYFLLATTQPPNLNLTAIQNSKNNINNPNNIKSSKKSNNACYNLAIFASLNCTENPSSDRNNQKY